jgi:hypothetical protein
MSLSINGLIESDLRDDQLIRSNLDAPLLTILT